MFSMSSLREEVRRFRRNIRMRRNEASDEGFGLYITAALSLAIQFREASRTITFGLVPVFSSLSGTVYGGSRRSVGEAFRSAVSIRPGFCHRTEEAARKASASILIA